MLFPPKEKRTSLSEDPFSRDDRTRTDDPQHPMLVHYQLCYIPILIYLRNVRCGMYELAHITFPCNYWRNPAS